LAAGEAPAGRTVSRWSGDNDRGTAVSSGLYLARLTTGDGEWTRRIVVRK